MPEQMRKRFDAKCKSMAEQDGYTTQNNIQLDLIDRWISGKIKLSWED